MRGMTRGSGRWVCGCLTAAVVAALLPQPAANADGKVVEEAPSRHTPAVRTGFVDSVAVVGPTVVIGGTFRRISDRGGKKPMTRRYLAAFDRKTGRVIRRFHPRLNGAVTSVVKVPGKSQVFVGGRFTKVNGKKAHHVVRLTVRGGKRVKRFRAPKIDGNVRAMDFANGRLYVGGQFKRVGGRRHLGLVALRPRNGHATKHIRLGVRGTLGGVHGHPKGRTGVLALDVAPGGKRMLIAGNFSRVGKHRRVQLAQIRLGRKARVMKWATRRYRARCAPKFDTYMREVAYARNGRYFVVATTGTARDKKSLCDTIARFNSRGQGARHQPQWVNRTGGDTLLSVAMARNAIYVGGHQRWMNNPYAKDAVDSGAVPRASLAALDPRTGMPLGWNPGRNPRGYGVTALKLTKQGLWVGGDTRWMGNRKYSRPRIALLPRARGRALPSEHQVSLPGTVYQLRGRPGATKAVDFNGKRVRGAEKVRLNGMGDLKRIRAGFVVGGRLVYALQNGSLRVRKFRRSGVGRARALNPYNDPEWSNVPTGSGQTYRGRDSGLRRDLRRVTGMFYRNGRLYYTMRGHSRLYWRPFSIDSGVSHPKRRIARSSIGWRNVRGLFRSGKHLYFAHRNGRRLFRVTFTHGRVRGKAHRLPANGHGVRWDNRLNLVYK